MSNVRSIDDITNDEVRAQAAQGMPYAGGGPMACCARIPIVTCLIALVEFLLWFIFIFIDPAVWFTPTNTYPMGIQHGEVWRLITPSLMHVGYAQIFFDVLFIFMMCVQVEFAIGSLAFIWLCVLLTVLVYLVNFVLSGIPYWAGGFELFYVYKTCGIYPLLSCLLILMLRMQGSKWTSFFMIFPIPSWVLPFIFVGLCMLFSFSYEIAFLLISGLIVGFLTWTGVLRFLIPPARFFQKCEKGCGRFPRWKHWVDATNSENIRHFPIKMGEGPEPFTCFCNRYKMPDEADVETRDINYGDYTNTATYSNHKEPSPKKKKNKNDGFTGKARHL